MGGEFYEEIKKKFGDEVTVIFDGNEHCSIILTEDEESGFDIRISEKTLNKIVKFVEKCRKSIDDYEKERGEEE